MQLSNEDRDILARIAHAGVDGPRARHAVIDVVQRGKIVEFWPSTQLFC
ncbi:MAG: hypothetical protein JKY49_13485 [Cohaesibacteraceae bacterium]|nr:hypothetical protein [Cohaesibacteraceae bacterium]MBL4876852.1 hypothetical protein [Cohaesibacteraceae bacterium]